MRLFEIQSPRAGEKLPLAHDLDWAHTELIRLGKQGKDQYNQYLTLDDPSAEQRQQFDQSRKELRQSQRELEDLIDAASKSHSLDQMPQAQLIWNTVRTRCADFLDICVHSKQMLYRGMAGSAQPALHGFSHQQRTPKDSDPAASAVFDYALKLVGMQAVRSNSIFVSANKFQSGGYGQPYMIFPVDGGYHYTYTTEKDLVLEPAQIVDMLDTLKLEKLYNAIKTVINTTDDPSTQSELSLLTSRYDLISDFARKLYKTELDWSKIVVPASLRSVINPASLNWRNYVDTNKFEAKYHPSNTDLESAMTKHIEIYVSGEYYALHDRLWGKFVRHELGIQEPTVVW